MEKYLKKTDGEVYGPVSADDLVHWASDGRIAPEDQISDDGKAWQPAPDMAELGMEWMVTLPDGVPYGPLHLYALVEFVRDGITNPEASITHKRSGQTQILSQALLQPLLDRNEALQNSVGTLRAHLAELREREKAIGKASDQAVGAAAAQEELNRKLQELRTRNQALKDEATGWESRCNQERKTAEQATADQQGTIQKQEAELARLREKGETAARDLGAARTEAESLRLELEEARQATPPPVEAGETGGKLQAALEKTRAEHQTERSRLQSRIKDLEQRLEESGDASGTHRELATTVDGLQRDVTKWKKLYDEVREGARTREDGLTQRIEELRGNEDAALTRLEDVNRRLRHTQRNYEMMAKAGEQAEGGPEAILAMQMSVLMDSHNELSQSYDTLFGQLESKAEELDHLMSERTEIETRAEERVKSMEDTLKREQEEADRARRQLAEMQQSHFQLVKSYREMNDRFIRIRQEIDHQSSRDLAPEKAAPTASVAAEKKGPRIRLNR